MFDDISPRDDRFFTPRTIARSNSASNSDEWQTPRGGLTPYVTPRSVVDGAPPKFVRSDTGSSAGSWHFADAKSGDEKASFYGGVASTSSYGYGQQMYDNSNNMGNIPKRMGHSNGMVTVPEQYDDFGATGADEEDLEDLFRFARHGRCEDLERLLDQKLLPIDIRDEYGNTILITGCQNGNKRVTKVALRRGANINARNYKGNTALHYCYHYGYGESLGQYLISKDADPYIVNQNGKLPHQGI